MSEWIPLIEPFNNLLSDIWLHEISLSIQTGLKVVFRDISGRIWIGIKLRQPFTSQYMKTSAIKCQIYRWLLRDSISLRNWRISLLGDKPYNTDKGRELFFCQQVCKPWNKLYCFVISNIDEINMVFSSCCHIITVLLQ